MDTEKGIENVLENFVSEKQKNLENIMHFGNMDRWRNKQYRLVKSLLQGFQLVLLPAKIELLLLWKECLLLAMTDFLFEKKLFLT